MKNWLEKAVKEDLDQLEVLRSQIEVCTQVLLQLEEKRSQNRRQYDLFEGFVAMMLTSPSVDDTVNGLLLGLQRLVDSPWYPSRKPEEARWLFVRQVLGAYLHCFRCTNCGAKFIIDMKPDQYGIGYRCPKCDLRVSVVADDSFLEALLYPNQPNEVTRAQELQRDAERLKPLEVFLDIPCAVCGKPMARNWTREEVLDIFKRCNWGHSACWNSLHGQFMLMQQVARLLGEKKKELGY